MGTATIIDIINELKYQMLILLILLGAISVKHVMQIFMNNGKGQHMLMLVELQTPQRLLPRLMQILLY